MRIEYKSAVFGQHAYRINIIDCTKKSEIEVDLITKKSANHHNNCLTNVNIFELC